MDDLGVFYTYPNNQVEIQVFAATGGGALSAPSAWWNSGTGQWDGTRVLPFVGDFTNNGTDDLGAFYGYDNSDTAIFTFLSTGSSLNAPDQEWDSGPGKWFGGDVLVA